MTTSAAAERPPRAGRREWIGLAVLTLACLDSGVTADTTTVKGAVGGSEPQGAGAGGV